MAGRILQCLIIVIGYHNSNIVPPVHNFQVTAVAGYGGIMDIVSQFGSHLCTFQCRGVQKGLPMQLI